MCPGVWNEFWGCVQGSGINFFFGFSGFLDIGEGRGSYFGVCPGVWNEFWGCVRGSGINFSIGPKMGFSGFLDIGEGRGSYLGCVKGSGMNSRGVYKGPDGLRIFFFFVFSGFLDTADHT